MTTTTPAAVTVDYPMPWQRGVYVARIVGPHGRFGFDRDFLTGKTNKREGRITYQLTPGWYETRTGTRDTPEVIAVDTSGQIEQHPRPATPATMRLLGKAGRRGETVDTPGAYSGRFCWCGDDATTYTDTGRARCAAHDPQETTNGSV